MPQGSASNFRATDEFQFDRLGDAYPGIWWREKRTKSIGAVVVQRGVGSVWIIC